MNLFNPLEHFHIQVDFFRYIPELVGSDLKYPKLTLYAYFLMHMDGSRYEYLFMWISNAVFSPVGLYLLLSLLF